VRRVLREPLIQFLLLGAALFAGTQMVARHTSVMNRQVVVDTPVEQRLAKLYELQMGAMPSRAQLDTLVERYIHDEILYREALRAGLDRDDEIIRRRLIQKIEFLDEDLAAIPEPSEQALQAFYRAHVSRFTAQPSVTFNHVYFSADSAGSQAARRRAEAVRVVLQSQPRTDGPELDSLGDPSPLPSSYTDLDEPDARRLFGQTQIVHELFTQPSGTWTGPFRSGYGWHLIRVTQRTSDAAEPFESARERVKQAYIEHAKQEANRQRYDQSRARYIITHNASTALAGTAPVAPVDNAE
jgi:peptidyl-prolyl cis-trans isomerase C